MSMPRSAISAISFWDWEITTAISVERMKATSDESRSCSLGPSPSGFRRASFGFEALCPEALDLLERADRRDLVDRHDEPLAGEAAAEEVLDDVLRDGVEAVVAGDQLVLLAERSGELAFLRLVEVGLLHDRHEVVAEGRVGDRDLRDAVLVVERDSRVIGGRRSEVVDRDVVPEHLAGALLARNQRRAGEPQEARVR